VDEKAAVAKVNAIIQIPPPCRLELFV